jgi:hypothetical protein
MATQIEMKRLGDDAHAVQRLATALLAAADVDWTDWERLFLEGMIDRRSREPLSARQSEVLVDLRDSAQVMSNVHGFSIARLVRDCWLSRFDLEDDEDLAFIERLKTEAPTTLKRRPAMRLLACANRLDVVPRLAEVG